MVLDRHSDPPYDIVVWGGGRTIEKRLPFAPRLPEHAEIDAVAGIAYFGDLNPPGVEIAVRAAGIAAELRLPPVRPAVELYRALLDAGTAPYGPDYRVYVPGGAGLASRRGRGACGRAPCPPPSDTAGSARPSTDRANFRDYGAASGVTSGRRGRSGAEEHKATLADELDPDDRN